MDKLKENLKLIFGLILAIVTGAFLVERSRRKSAEAVADNKEMLDELNKGDAKIAKNDGQLAAEEEKRNDIKKETDAAKRDDSSDPADYFNRRK